MPARWDATGRVAIAAPCANAVPLTDERAADIEIAAHLTQRAVLGPVGTASQIGGVHTVNFSAISL